MPHKYPHLFEPFAIGKNVYRNRIFAAPRGFYNVGKDNLPGRDAAAFYERGAMGGFASVCVGDCIVEDETGTHYPFLIRMEDTSTLPGLSTVADAIRRHDAVASAELSHAGMYAQYVKNPDKTDFGPEDGTSRELETEGTGTLYGPIALENGKYGRVEQMSEEMILRIIDKFGRAAAWAKRCGFNMVTVHGGHGWLLSQFASPVINTRNDMWGGTLENRMRMPLAVIESIRRYVGPGFVIEYRMSGDECDENGYDINEGVKIAKALDNKVDIIHVSTGNHEREDAFLFTHPSIFMPDGVNVRFAAEIKKHVKTPVAAVGGLTDPRQMEEIIASGQADIVNLGRQTLADPDLPNKARTGREDDINKCIRCCECFGQTGEHRYLRCATNPAIGHEVEEKYETAPKHRRRVLIAGGGVGGMQAAITAAERGHEVTLCEKSDKLGGVLRCESEVPFKQKLHAYIERQAQRVDRAGVEIKLNTKVTPELAKSLSPDVIVAALGAVPQIPPIDGIDGAIVLSAETAYIKPELVGGKAVILGAGLVGLELAIFLKQRGCEICIVEMQDKPTINEFGTHTMAIMQKLAELELSILLKTRAKKITPDGVECENENGAFKIEADTVIYATGQSPLRSESFALSDIAPEFHQLGDCVTPGNILSATQNAYSIAKDIGRM